MSNSSKTYRVAIVGCGPRGNAAALGYGAHPRTTVVGMGDVFPEKVNELGDRYGLPSSARYLDLDKMIRETRPDIAVIATQADYHYELGMQALEGYSEVKNVYVSTED